MAWFSNPYTIQRMPKQIFPEHPNFALCDPHYGQELSKKDCKNAIVEMPLSRQGAEVSWAVNFRAQQYNLPMTIRPAGDDPTTCVVSIEVAGPSAFYDRTKVNIPFTIMASPFQLRGLASRLYYKCVTQSTTLSNGNVVQRIGGFATDKLSNLIDYVSAPTYNPLDPYPTSTSFITVSLVNPHNTEPSPGDYDPSIAVLIEEYLANKARGANNALRGFLNGVITQFSLREQAMTRGGSTQTWWGTVSESASEMTYECDASLGAPAAVDCQQVEWSELGPDDSTFSIGPGVLKFLSSNTCQVAITAATAITLNWRQIRIAMDTLFNLCVTHPIFPATGGRAYYGPQPVVSRRSRSRIWERQDDGVTGLNALPPGVNMTVASSALNLNSSSSFNLTRRMIDERDTQWGS